MTTHSVDLMEAADVLYELLDGQVVNYTNREEVEQDER